MGSSLSYTVKTLFQNQTEAEKQHSKGSENESRKTTHGTRWHSGLKKIWKDTTRNRKCHCVWRVRVWWGGEQGVLLKAVAGSDLRI